MIARGGVVEGGRKEKNRRLLCVQVYLTYTLCRRTGGGNVVWKWFPGHVISHLRHQERAGKSK